ncbi:MAG: sulfatase-like hydrolase/transferase, partial [Acidobacteriota bacterium]|nr:sulfatase-like hydrolase/transferase [Acidobacteriota bacterium]
TLAEILRAAGYATGAVGKWQLGWDDGAHPLDRGFDEFFGMQSGNIYFEAGVEGSESWSPEPIPETRRRPLFRGREPTTETEYLTEAFTREALDFIDRHHEGPFFLYLAHYTPHVPLMATRKYLDRYRHVEDPKQRLFAAMVASLDDSVGAVVGRRAEHGLEDDTMIVFLSDNGCALYVDGACSNLAFRGGKRWFFEGGVRVPFIVRWPLGAPAGSTYEAPVSSLDLLPTIAAATGADLPQKPLDGVDVLPFVTGTASGTPHESLFWRAGPNRAVRAGDWKLWQVNRGSDEQLAAIGRVGGLLPDFEAPHGSPLGQLDRLHHLGNDPGERDERSDTEPEVLERLRRALDSWEAELVEPRWWSKRGTAAEIDGQPVELIF